jgi:DNA-binding GntR family transcriptional regulator
MANQNSDYSLEVNEENLADHSARYIRDMFLNGEILPGERIIEADIANHLGLSRGPVRDALKILEKEGLVVITPRKGASVAELTLEAVYEIYSLRAVLLSTHRP